MNTQIFDIFPVIRLNNGIILRKIVTDTDHSDFFNYITKPEVTSYLSIDDIPNSIETARIELDYWARLFDRHASFYWAIAANNKIIGTCGFNFWNKSQKRAEISYDLDHNHWSKGITTQAIKAIVDFGLKEMQVQRIQATVAIDNIPSIKVLEKNGFKREGFLEKYGILNGESRDFYMYAICS